jgi:hypothetical protein
MCDLSFVHRASISHSAGVLSGMRCGDVVALNGAGCGDVGAVKRA